MNENLLNLYGSNNEEDIKLATRMLCREDPELCTFPEEELKIYQNEKGQDCRRIIPGRLAKEVNKVRVIHDSIIWDTIREVINEELYLGNLEKIQEKFSFEY